MESTQGRGKEENYISIIHLLKREMYPLTPTHQTRKLPLGKFLSPLSILYCSIVFNYFPHP
jgi:hypothetical protein